MTSDIKISGKVLVTLEVTIGDAFIESTHNINQCHQWVGDKATKFVQSMVDRHGKESHSETVAVVKTHVVKAIMMSDKWGGETL